MDARIGKSNSLIMPSDAALSHPSASRLLSYAIEGCPANCGENWKLEYIQKAALRGAHRSALHPVARTVLRKETMEKVRQGFAKVVSFKSLLKNMPANLKISPIAMIPHKSRQFRAILDLSFELKLNGKKCLQLITVLILRSHNTP